MRWLRITSVAAVLTLPMPVTFLVVMVISFGVASAQECGPAGPAQKVVGVQLSSEQLADAMVIVNVTQDDNMPPRAAVIAVATAYQESELKNLPDLGPRNDHDSLGLFQQRGEFYGNAPNWKASAADPISATNAFLDRLAKVQNWWSIPLTEAAQAVQRSAYPDAYAQWEPMAEAIVDQLWPGAAALECDSGFDDGCTSACLSAAPPGLVLPGNPQRRQAVEFALAQIGKPYVWGGVGPDGYDCAGLVMKAWASAGVPIPEGSEAQFRTLTPRPDLAAMEPGDLIFVPGKGGTPTRPDHVGMYIGEDGKGVRYLVQAPHTGLKVMVTRVNDWLTQPIVGIGTPILASDKLWDPRYTS